MKVLLDRGLDEQHRDNAGWGPVHYAAFEGKSSIRIFPSNSDFFINLLYEPYILERKQMWLNKKKVCIPIYILKYKLGRNR